MKKDHSTEIDPTASVTEQASSWWTLLNNGDATAVDHRAFCEWVARSPERVDAFLQSARLSRMLRSDKVRWPDTPVAELIRAAKAAPCEVINLPSARAEGHSNAPSADAPRGFRLATVTGRRIAAAAAIALVALGSWLYGVFSPERFRTALGEQRSVVLNDGSVVTLNTSSSIEVRLTRGHRIVRLLAGEALFQVAHDAARPFDVTAGETTVRAVGTQFNVDRRVGGTTVTVVEGRVAVFTPDPSQDGEAEKLPLAAGEQLTVAPRIKPHTARADAAAATAWTQRKLVFDHRPLGEVAGEFNRYNRQSIEIQGGELRSQEITGVFATNDPESFITFLAQLPELSIEHDADRRRIIVTLDDRVAAPK
ncbi:MAG: FecR domain-containing protein [Gammaproteobacteria bacterium]